MTTAEYKELNNQIKEKVAKFNEIYNKDGKHAQRVADYEQGLSEMLDMIYMSK